jgi:hypothetical protein
VFGADLYMVLAGLAGLGCDLNYLYMIVIGLAGPGCIWSR